MDRRRKTSFHGNQTFYTNSQILAYPDFSATFILDTDASNLGVCEVYFQKCKDDSEHTIAYYSRGFNKHEKFILLLEQSF